MTLPPIVRVFFAIDLPDAVKEKLAKYIVSLKKRAKSNGIRWTKSENLHITLHFLAQVQTEHLATLIENVRKRVEGAVKNSTLAIGGVHLFPNPYRPRVIVLEVTPSDQLTELVGLIGEGIKSTQYEVENRPFRAHLTLGRIKHAQNAHLEFLSEGEPPQIEQFLVDEVVLFRSEPQQDGSKYTVLERFKLECAL